MARRCSIAVILALLSALALSGCVEGSNEMVSTSPEPLRISGSGTALPLMRILTDAYESQDVEFVYLPGLHSGGGIRGVANGDLEIGAVSRELDVEEATLDLDYVELADDGLIVAVNPSVTIDGLTTEQVREIYRGEHQNWSELGGPDIGIVILDRNEDESAKIILRQYVLGSDLEIADTAVNLFYEPDMIEALEQTEGAIGYFSLGFGLSENIPVNYLSLDGVEASVETIESGEYEMTRPLGVVVSKMASDSTTDFVAWAQSAEARQLMAERGFAPPSSAGE